MSILKELSPVAELKKNKRLVKTYFNTEYYIDKILYCKITKKKLLITNFSRYKSIHPGPEAYSRKNGKG